MWQISAVLLRFCLSSFGFTITCGLLIAISLTRMFIIVKVTTYDPLISPPHLSADCVSQSEPRADFLRGLHQPRHPLPCLQLRLGRPLPKQRHGWVVQYIFWGIYSTAKLTHSVLSFVDITLSTLAFQILFWSSLDFMSEMRKQMMAGCHLTFWVPLLLEQWFCRRYVESWLLFQQTL